MTTSVKETPIFMFEPMVSAIKAGLKTQIRRPVRGLPSDAVNVRLVADRLKYGSYSDASTAFGRIESPYGWIGDSLLVLDGDLPPLPIVSLRVERLYEITAADALAEGVQAWVDIRKGGEHYDPDAQLSAWPVTAFSRMWSEIYGPESWNANPWVWVISFERVTP